MAGQNQMGEYYVDIVMCIDVTGSMAPIIEEVKANALTLYQSFVDGMEEDEKSVEQLRIKVIAFGDYGCDENPMQESEFFVLPDQTEQFNAFINGLTATGGGDGPENALEAIALALKSDWTRVAGKKKRHAIVVFTDAPALALGERAGCPGYPEGMPESLAQLGAWWEGTDQSVVVDQKAKRLFLFAPNAEPWTDLPTWNQVWPTFSAAGTGLNDVQMQEVVSVMVGSF